MSRFSTKTGAVTLALTAVISLIILKAAVSLLTGSISITAQAVDSALDLFSIGVIFIAVRAASKPEDKEHPFGHGKMEGFAAIVQAGFIGIAGYFIVASAIERIIHKTPLEATEAGIAVMAVSMLTSVFLSRHLKKVSRATGSTALDALASNINADIFSAAGVLLGLIVVRLTDLLILDPIIALIMVVFIARSGFLVLRRAFRELTDRSLPPEEQQLLAQIMEEHRQYFAGFHEVRSRRAGSQRFIDLHMVMPRDASVAAAHELCDHLEQDIKQKLANPSVIIHVEPCVDTECSQCRVRNCRLRVTA